MNCKHSINSLWLRVNLLIELLNLYSRVNSLISYFTLPRYDWKRKYWMKPFPEPEPIPYGTVSSLFFHCKLINLFLFIPSKTRSKKMKGCSLRSLWSLWLDSLPLFIEVNRRMILFTLLRGKWNRCLSVSSLCLNCKLINLSLLMNLCLWLSLSVELLTYSGTGEERLNISCFTVELLIWDSLTCKHWTQARIRQNYWTLTCLSVSPIACPCR